MAKKETDVDGITEARLVELLVLLRAEPVAEADYEERFVQNLRDRIARDAVCRPARTLLWEHIKQRISNISLHKWVWGTGICCGVGVLGISLLIPQPEGAPLAVASVKAPVAAPAAIPMSDSSFARLCSPASPDKFTCISVSGERRTPFTHNHRALQGAVRIFEADSVIVYELGRDVFSVQGSPFAEGATAVFASVEDKAAE